MPLTKLHPGGTVLSEARKGHVDFPDPAQQYLIESLAGNRLHYLELP